jgi:hypothetical protein
MARLFLLALAASLGGCDKATPGSRDLAVAVELDLAAPVAAGLDFAVPVAAEPDLAAPVAAVLDFGVGDLLVSYSDPPYTPGQLACPVLSFPDDAGPSDAGCPWCCCVGSSPYCSCAGQDRTGGGLGCINCDGPEDCAPPHVCCSGLCSADGTCILPYRVLCKLPVDCPSTAPYCCVPKDGVLLPWREAACYAYAERLDLHDSSYLCQAR